MPNDKIHRQDGFSAGASRTSPTFQVNRDGSVRADGSVYIAGTTTFSGAIDSDDSELAINEAGADLNVRIESDTNSNHFVSDAGQYSGVGAFSFGAAVSTQAYVLENSPAFTASANTSTFRHWIYSENAMTVPTGTAPVVASLRVEEPNLTATGTITDAYSLYITGAPSEGTRNGSLWVDDGVSRFDDSVVITAGTNLTEPSGMTVGLFIEQAGNDDSAIMLSSTNDVAHGFTAIVPTGAYADIRKAVAADGGLQITGLSDGTTTFTTVLRGIQTAAMDTTRSTAARGTLELYGTLGSGTDVTNATANGNLVVVRTRSGGADVARFILDTDGDSHQDVGTTWTNFDTYDDVALLNGLAGAVSNPADPLRAGLMGWAEQHRDTLESQRIVKVNDGPGEDGSVFINWSRANMLVIGALRQMGERLTNIERKLLGE